jgi:hypothetical protein
MGVKLVSSLQFPSEMIASTTASVQEEDSGLKGIRLHKEDRAKSIPVDLEPEKSENDDFSPVQDSGTQLRHRRGAKAEKVSLEGLNKDRKMSTRGSCSDPLRWFGVLVPQSLRSAKKIFNEAVEMAIQVTNLQMKLEQMRTKYQQLLIEKSQQQKDNKDLQ